MKHELEYTKSLLKFIEAYPQAVMPLNEFLNSDLVHDDSRERFIHHIDILIDREFIATSLSNNKWYARSTGGEIQWASPKLRLTAQGQDFLSLIKESDVWEVLKKDFRESSVDTIKSVAKDLAIGFAKKQAQEYLK